MQVWVYVVNQRATNGWLLWHQEWVAHGALDLQSMYLRADLVGGLFSQVQVTLAPWFWDYISAEWELENFEDFDGVSGPWLSRPRDHERLLDWYLSLLP